MRRLASDRQINNSFPGLLAVKMIRQQISLTNRLTHQSTTLTNERRQCRTRPEHCRFKSGLLLMRGINIHKNIAVSVTKLMLGLLVGFISSHLTTDKLFPVNTRAIVGPPKMSLLLAAKIMPAFIIKQRLILVTHTDNLSWYKTSNQQGQIFVQNNNRIVSKSNVTLGQIPYCTTDSILIHLMFQENFPTHTKVWNSLSHRNDCRQRGVT